MKTKRINLVNLINSSSKETKSNVMAVELKQIAEEQVLSTRGGIIDLKSGSKILPIKVGAKKNDQPSTVFSHENLKQLGNRLNLSDNSLM